MALWFRLPHLQAIYSLHNQFAQLRRFLFRRQNSGAELPRFNLLMVYSLAEQHCKDTLRDSGRVWITFVMLGLILGGAAFSHPTGREFNPI